MAISGRGSLKSGGDRETQLQQWSLHITFISQSLDMNEAGNQDGHGMGTGFLWDKSRYLNLSEELVLD